MSDQENKDTKSQRSPIIPRPISEASGISKIQKGTRIVELEDTTISK
jgi:hypothetical protein